MVDPLLIPCGPPRPPDPVPFAPSEPPVGSSDGRGFAGNVENRQMIIASGPPKTRAGMRLEAGGWRTIQRVGKGSSGILRWVQMRFIMVGLSCENRNFLWWFQSIMLIA